MDSKVEEAMTTGKRMSNRWVAAFVAMVFIGLTAAADAAVIGSAATRATIQSFELDLVGTTESLELFEIRAVHGGSVYTKHSAGTVIYIE